MRGSSTPPAPSAKSRSPTSRALKIVTPTPSPTPPWIVGKILKINDRKHFCLRPCVRGDPRRLNHFSVVDDDLRRMNDDQVIDIDLEYCLPVERADRNATSLLGRRLDDHVETSVIFPAKCVFEKGALESDDFAIAGFHIAELG